MIENGQTDRGKGDGRKASKRERTIDETKRYSLSDIAFGYIAKNHLVRKWRQGDSFMGSPAGCPVQSEMGLE